MPVAVNDYFLATLEGNCYGQRIMFTHTYRCSDNGGGAVTENAASLALITALMPGGVNDIVTKYRACLPSVYELTRVKVQKIWPVRFRYYFATVSLFGSHFEPGHYTNLAGIVTLTSRLAGRGEIANKHVGPHPDGPTASVGGVLTVAYKTLLDQFAQTLEVEIPSGPGTMKFMPIILHRQLDVNGHIIGMSSTDVFMHSIGETVNTMSRRTVGRGI